MGKSASVLHKSHNVEFENGKSLFNVLGRLGGLASVLWWQGQDREPRSASGHTITDGPGLSAAVSQDIHMPVGGTPLKTL